ncbi:MAG: hypothetical protein PVI33_04535, partial [Candidatus Omnitrophota bacterium]
RFGKVSAIGPRINKEVIVNITSDIGKQYHLVQRLLEPLTNAQGVSLSQNNFFVYGIRGTNKYGNLAVEQEVPVFLGRTILYTSNPGGLPDSFNLVYNLKGPFNVPAGSYRGRIAFTLEPIDATQQEVTAILNIFAEIEIESGIEIKTITGGRIISLSSAREEANSSDVLFEIKGGLGSQFRILQQLQQPLKSQDGQELPLEAVNFQLREASKGTGPFRALPLSLRQEAIYTSGPRGELDSFIITYSLGDLSKATAGRYRTALRYLLDETIPAQTNPIDFYDLEVEIERVFDIAVETEIGVGIIEFRDLKPRQPPKTYEVAINIMTNIGKQYQVTQKATSDLVNREGQVIPQGYFTLRTESLETKGVLKFAQNSPVKKGDTVLFISDRDGSADSFKVIYELTCPAEIKAGDYSTSVVYSLSEL